jgi:hypothetical protein
MSELIPASFTKMPVSARFANVQPTDELSQGIQSSYGLIGYKGKVWSIRYRGDEQQLMRDDGDGPRGSIEVVILKASTQISKIWYEQGYVEGSSAPPDCFSNNGVVPEEASVKKQCDSCAVCPHNQWGSRLTPAGKAGKACADSKRIAVAPLADLNNEAYGGPMLLRIPAASLQDLASFGQKLQQMGYPSFAIGTKIAFDPAESYPKMVFSGIRPLNDAEADIVLGLRDSHAVQRILSESEFNPSPAATGTPAAAKEQPFFEQAPELGTASQQASQPVKKAETKVPPVQPSEEPKKASGFGATAPAGQSVQQTTQQTTQQAAPVTQEVTEPEESDEDREIREAEEKLLAIRAAAQAKKAQKDAAGNAAANSGTVQSSAVANTQANGATTSNAGQTAQTSASPSDDSQNMASSFEANLDDMLTKLLP